MAKIERQAHGIRAETLNMTLGADEVARLRREAAQRGITVSRHIRDLVRYAWACRELHDAVPAREPEALECAS